MSENYLMRSLMFVPAHNQKLLDSSLRRDADVLLLDIEDSVPVVDKQQARDNIKKRNWPVAQTILISFLKEHPDNKEAKQLLVKVYRGLGLNTKAEELEAEIRAMR